MKKALYRWITFIAGLYFLLEFVLPKKMGGYEFGLYHEQILDGARTVGAMAIGLGVINILFVHGSRLIKRSRGGLESAAVILGFLLMVIFQGAEFIASEKAVTVWQNYASVKEYLEKNREAVVTKNENQPLELALKFYATESGKLPAASDKLSQNLRQEIAKETELLERLTKMSDRGEQFDALIVHTGITAKLAQEYYPEVAKQGLLPQLSDFLFYGFFVPLGASMFALLGFYIVSAAYNSFRARSVEAAVMMLAAVLVILGQIPQGSLYISEHLPSIRLWLLENLNTPANRAIYFGSAIAGLAMAVRLWLSLDKNQIGGDR